MRKPIAAANWKMNGDFALVEAFAKHAWPQGNVEKIFGLPAIYISKAHELGLEILAGEDVSAHASGAHTGEISAAMLKEAGARYAIIGHSERRTDHGENEALLIEKWKQLKAQGLKVIYCIGESLQEYDAGQCDAAVLRQMNPVLEAGLVDADTVIAYEPIWAIGTGKTATFEQAEELLRREPSDCQPRLVLNVPDGTNFFDIKAEDFDLLDYNPVKPQLKFDLAI